MGVGTANVYSIKILFLGFHHFSVSCSQQECRDTHTSTSFCAPDVLLILLLLGGHSYWCDHVMGILEDHLWSHVFLGLLGYSTDIY